MKRELNGSVSGNEVYHSISLKLLVNNMLCRKLYCQKGFNLILFSYNIRRGVVRVERSVEEERQRDTYRGT